MKRLEVKMEDPVLAPGSARTAVLNLTVTPVNVPSSVKVFLATSATGTPSASGTTSFVSTGVVQTIRVNVTMPTSGTWKVFVDLSALGQLVAAFVATEDVTIGKLPPCGSYGDVDGDGFVTAADAQLVADFAAGVATLTAAQKTRADVDANGVVDVGDASMISQYVTGTRNTFPICSLAGTITAITWE